MSRDSPRVWFLFAISVDEDELHQLKQFIQAHCVHGKFCANPEKVGLLCRVQFSTKRRETWLRQQAVVRHAVIATGEELKRLSDVMKAVPMAWDWLKPKPDAVLDEKDTSADDGASTHMVMIDNSTNNSNTNVFNLNVYLQDACQDAPNLADFVQGITASMTDIDYVNDRATWDYAERLARMPYAEGVAKLLTDKLSELDQTERPIQCTDGKRGAFQIKHLGEWQSGHLDDAVGTPFRDALHGLGQTRVGFALQWRRHNSTLEFGDDHATIMKNVTVGASKQQSVAARKRIISELAKQTAIVK
jgi:hypothetical protein